MLMVMSVNSSLSEGGIDTTVIGEQKKVVAHVEDNAGNVAEQTLSFNIKDSVALTLTLKT